ncbi:MAG: UTP--glucose-1-phosphate uridylyltransferase [Candidatus Methanospirareceae archaeon]
MIKKAVITTAGEGTRMLPVTKEQPKEMLPLFDKTVNGGICVKPLLQIIFELLFEFGIRDFCFITGRGKRSIEEHFTQDYAYLQSLRERGKAELAEELENFYQMLDSSNIFWKYQPKPTGFGDAVLLSEPFVQDEPFLVCAGDTYIQSPKNDCFKRLRSTFEVRDPDAVFLTFEVEDPKMYGVIEGEEIGGDIYEVKRVVEKPEKPPSNLAILPVYIFKPIIFRALEKIPYGKGNEKQLTDGIQKVIEWGFEVLAVKLNQTEKRLDIGNPEFYAEAVYLSAKWVGISWTG